MTKFRVATVNVHSFNNPSKYESNVTDLISVFAPLDLDLIAAQEMQEGDKWNNFCRSLSLPYAVRGTSNKSTFGNGIASRYPIVSSTVYQAEDFYAGGPRALMQCSLSGDHPFIQKRTFAVTHLDHINEENRLAQIKQFHLDQQKIDVLLGDMNSLTREDYTDDYFDLTVKGQRRKSYWEKPKFFLTDFIKECGYEDVFQKKNPRIKDEQLATCPYGTRIDYVFIHPRVNEQWYVSECSIIDTKGFTDHQAVLVEFQMKTQ